MNKLKNMFGEVNSLNLRDIVNWKINGKWTTRYMLYQADSGKIGLINIESAITADVSFDNLVQAKEHFKKLKVDDNEIFVTSSVDWVVYVP